MFRVGLLGVVLWTSIAMGKPLPDGMKISLKGDKLTVQYRGVAVSLRGAEADDRDPASSFDGAELSSDSAKLLIKASTCMRMGEDSGPASSHLFPSIPRSAGPPRRAFGASRRASLGLDSGGLDQRRCAARVAWTSTCRNASV